MLNYFNIFNPISLLENTPITISNKTTITKPLFNNTILKKEFEPTKETLEAMKKLTYKELRKAVDKDLKLINGY